MEDLTCGLCLGPFVSPVTLACTGGHSFCQSCITPWLAREAEAPTCPLDRCAVPRQPPAVSRVLVQALAAAEAAKGRGAALPTIPASDIALGAILGSGAYGQVQRAVYRGTPVAVKSLQLSPQEAGEGAVKAFEREMRALGALHHPNVVQVMGVVALPEGRLGLVEELAEGGELSGLVRPGEGRLSRERVVAIGLDVARGLAYAHARGVSHCDLKSGNVLMAAGGVAKLCDFGQASRVRAALPGTAGVILSSTAGEGGMLGTPAWMAPENFVPGEGYGQPPGDVYSLGCVLYEMVKGEAPWAGFSWMQIGRAVDRGQRPERPEGVEKRMWRLIERCWAGEARQRPSAAEVVGVLAEWKGRQPPGGEFVMPLDENGYPDFGPEIEGSLAQWRAANPDALIAHIRNRGDVTDADLAALVGIKALEMTGCTAITDAALVHLTGIHTLHMEGCNAITDAAFVQLSGIHTLIMGGCTAITDAAFVHLTGIHTLDMGGCSAITDAAFVHLAGIHTLSMWGCTAITDAAFVHLTAIHTLDMRFCTAITDAAFVHLTGIHTLNMEGCNAITDAAFVQLSGIHTLTMGGCTAITDAAFVHLAGIHTLDITDCTSITNAAFVHLTGIHTLYMWRCSNEVIASARARGLPVVV